MSAVDAISTVITMVDMKHDSAAGAAREWKSIAQKLGIEIVEDEALLEQRRQAELAKVAADFGGFENMEVVD